MQKTPGRSGDRNPFTSAPFHSARKHRFSKPSLGRLLRRLICGIVLAAHFNPPVWAIDIKRLSLATNDLLYVPSDGKLYAAVPSAVGPGGNSIAVINPDSATVEHTVFVGSEPTTLALADDGRTLYVSLYGAAAVRAFDIPSRTPGTLFSLGTDPNFGTLYPGDMIVVPGTTDSLIVDLINTNGNSQGFAVFDKGVKRQRTARASARLIRNLGSSSVLYGWGNYELTVFNISAGGVDVANKVPGLSIGLSAESEGSLIYGADGSVIDPVGFKRKGRYMFADVTSSAFVAPDTKQGVTYVYFDPGSNAPTPRLLVFDQRTFLLKYSFDLVGIPGISSNSRALGFAKIGENRFVVRAARDVYIIRLDDSVPTSSPRVTYPQFALGGGYEVVVLMTNKSDSAWDGRASLLEGNAKPWSSPWKLNGDSLGRSNFDVKIPPGGTRRYVFAADGAARAGYFVISGALTSTTEDLEISFFYNLRDRGELVDAVAVFPGVAGQMFHLPVERSSTVDTGVAWSPQSPIDPALSTTIFGSVYDNFGRLFSSLQSSYTGQTAKLINEMTPGIPANFTGSISIVFGQPVHLTAFRIERSGTGIQLTSLRPELPE